MSWLECVLFGDDAVFALGPSTSIEFAIAIAFAVEVEVGV